MVKQMKSNINTRKVNNDSQLNQPNVKDQNTDYKFNIQNPEPNTISSPFPNYLMI